MRRWALAMAPAVATLWLLTSLATSEAADVKQYVLALSWSPTYCASADAERDHLQCNADADNTFIVHGLWPDDGSGRLHFCRTGAPDPTRRQVDALLDLMPSRGLVRYQWRKHGRCSGLPPRDYFDLVRRARERVTVPPLLSTLDEPLTVSPTTLRQAFRRLNPGLTDDGMMISCRRDRLVEVRVCLTPALEFTSCLRPPRRCPARNLQVTPPL